MDLYLPQGPDTAQVCARVLELVELNKPQWVERDRVRQVMNSRQAMVALLGNTIRDPDVRMPVANLMLKADETLARKIGRRPDTKVDPPATSDSETSHKKAEKRARIVDSFDDLCDMEALLPQVGRWLPGYGFVAAVVKQDVAANGDPFPMVELRDPYQTFPGRWGTKQQPRDMACIYTMSRSDLAERYPQHKAELLTPSQRRGPGGALLLDGGGMSIQSKIGWSSQSGSGVDVYEYYDQRGCWWVVPESNLRLEYTPNLLSSPQFRIVKRFAFDELVGAFDHALGVMANMARLALLATIAVEDTVMSETNIIGDLRGDKYRRGRNSVNILAPGSTVAKMNSHVPFEAFNMIDRMERQLRLIANHSSQEDGESSLNFATGEGLRELAASSGMEVREYQTQLARWLRDLDGLRLEWDDKIIGAREKMMYGVRSGTPFAESYTPSKDIKGDYRTRRVYGVMAGFDDATTIITGLQLLSAEVIDVETLRENIDGLENHSKIEERVKARNAEKVVEGALAQMAASGQPEAIQAMLHRLPDSEWKTQLEEIFVKPAEDQQQQPAAPPGGGAGGLPPDVQTVMSRLTQDGDVQGGSQIVQRVA